MLDSTTAAVPVGHPAEPALITGTNNEDGVTSDLAGPTRIAPDTPTRPERRTAPGFRDPAAL